MAIIKGTVLVPLEKRFWTKVIKTDTCWLWTASTCNYGYGKIRIKGKNERAHRVSWEMVNGKIPNGMILLHKCDNPACVNPDHLYVGTQLDNIKDMKSKNRHAHGETSYSKITTEQAMLIRKDTRTQRAIANDYGLCQQTISLIKRGINWKHLDTR